MVDSIMCYNYIHNTNQKKKKTITSTTFQLQNLELQTELHSFKKIYTNLVTKTYS